jgi:hypothetical protein
VPVMVRPAFAAVTPPGRDSLSLTRTQGLEGRLILSESGPERPTGLPRRLSESGDSRPVACRFKFESGPGSGRPRCRRLGESESGGLDRCCSDSVAMAE